MAKVQLRIGEVKATLALFGDRDVAGGDVAVASKYRIEQFIARRWDQPHRQRPCAEFEGLVEPLLEQLRAVGCGAVESALVDEAQRLADRNNHANASPIEHLIEIAGEPRVRQAQCDAPRLRRRSLRCSGPHVPGYQRAQCGRGNQAAARNRHHFLPRRSREMPSPG